MLHAPSGGDPLLIFVTGGVISGVGKGVAAASLGALLRARGARVRLRKVDPYLNVDCGTMAPYEHGEVFVTDDGAETDLDLGHYERFTGQNACRWDSITTGQIYKEILEKERRGDYLGRTVQVIPHVTDAIKQSIVRDLESVDVLICEIGGTVGDIESLPSLEAIRQLRRQLGAHRTLFIHVTWIIHLPPAGEVKTKPVQHSVKTLQQFGIQPDILVCRATLPVPEEDRQKIARFCNVDWKNVIEARTADHLYAAPLAYHAAGLDDRVCEYFERFYQAPGLKPWQDVVHALRHPQQEVRIGIVGKYTALPDAYFSLREALTHGGLPKAIGVHIDFLSAESLEEAGASPEDMLHAYDAILVPGGYGVRGTEGMMRAIGVARKKKIPFLGVCFGMQLAIIEAARNEAGLTDATSSEFDKNAAQPVVALLEEWIGEDGKQRYEESFGLGGTMRLGSFPCQLQEGSFLRQIYGGQAVVHERHRHRYEINGSYKHILASVGVNFSGTSAGGHILECIERRDHPWFIGVQFHPELKSRPFEPHPLFVGFVEAALAHRLAKKPEGLF